MFDSPGAAPRILESTHELVSVMDLTGRFRFANLAHRRLLGLLPQDLAGTMVLDLVHPDDRAAAAIGLSDAVAGLGLHGGVPIRLRKADGGWALFQVDGAPLRGRDEQPGIVLVSREVTIETAAGTEEMERISAMLRGQQEASRDGILMVGPGGETLSYNQRFLDLWGLAPADADAGYQARAEKVLALLKVPVETLALIDRIYAEPRAVHELVVEMADGRFLDMHTAPVLGPHSEVFGRIWFYRDVSERVRSDRELKASEERYRRLVELSPNGIGVHQEGALRYINQAGLHLLNVRAEEVLGRNVFAFVHPDDLAAVRRASLGQESDSPGVVEIRLRRPDGVELNVEVASSPTQFDGRPATQTVLHDVTGSRAAERALRESEERYRSLVENAPDPIYVHDGTRIMYANPVAARFLGFGQPRDLVGLDPYEVIRGIDRATFSGRIGRVLAGETLRVTERRFIVFEGREADLEIALSPASFSGQPVVQVMVRDLTELRVAEQQRLALERKLLETQKLESLGVLAGGIAHDFNNLLVAIMGNAGLAMRDIAPESAAALCLHEIEVASQRAADLARQMLDYSGKGRFVIEPINLTEIVREMADLLAVSLPRKATLDCTFSDDLPAVAGDATQVRQVVMNLVINAAEALGEAPGTISLQTGVLLATAGDLAGAHGDAHGPGEYVFVRVTDTGAGMDRDTLARVFDPFFTTKFTGRGLGLAAVLGIVRGHHGAIRVTSTRGKGTTFQLLLPASPSTRAGASPAPVAGPGARFSGRAMVVDDEAPVRNVAARMLERLGLEVATAADGDDALTLLDTTGHFDLLLIDMTMPRVSGEELLAAVRRRGSTVPVIVMSGYSEQDAAARFQGERATRFLQKPFTLQEAESAVAEVLAGS